MLRAPRRDDAETVFRAYAQDREVARYLTWRPHQSECGLEFEGVLRRHTVHPSLSPEPRDVRCYARTR